MRGVQRQQPGCSGDVIREAAVESVVVAPQDSAGSAERNLGGARKLELPSVGQRLCAHVLETALTVCIIPGEKRRKGRRVVSGAAGVAARQSRPVPHRFRAPHNTTKKVLIAHGAFGDTTCYSLRQYVISHATRAILSGMGAVGKGGGGWGGAEQG